MMSARGKDATVRFLGVPILYSPWLSFALNDERKSGFLMPTYGSSNNSGLHDFHAVLLEHRAQHGRDHFEAPVLTQTRVAVGGDFRYLNAAYGGATTQ
jgi:LPS-assembly protein